LKEIKRNQTKEQEIEKELEKDNGQAWEDNEIVYVEGKIYVPNNRKIWEQVLQKNHNPADIGYSRQ